jgi:hypothetical protein
MIPIIEVEEYLTEKGASPFGEWFKALNPPGCRDHHCRFGATG